MIVCWAAQTIRLRTVKGYYDHNHKSEYKGPLHKKEKESVIYNIALISLRTQCSYTDQRNTIFSHQSYKKPILLISPHNLPQNLHTLVKSLFFTFLL